MIYKAKNRYVERKDDYLFAAPVPLMVQRKNHKVLPCQLN